MQSIIKNIFGRHLFLTNTGISFGLSGIGDLLEQKMESNQKQKNKFNINWTRTLHMSTSFGLTSGVMCHFWYNYLDRTLPGRGIKVVVQKIAWDQVCPCLPSSNNNNWCQYLQVFFSPLCIAACLVVAGKMENKSNSSLVSQTVQLGGRLYLAEWVIWPPAQFINCEYQEPLREILIETFTVYFLPTKYRVLYDNLVSLVYDTYTSHVKHTVPVIENFEEEIIRWIPTSENFNKLLENDCD